MKNEFHVPSPGPFLIRLGCGIGLPFLAQIPIAVVVHAGDVHAMPEIIGLSLWLANIAAGFALMTHRWSVGTRFAAAFAYIPAMFVLLFVESYSISVDYLHGESF